ncbi:MAG: 30S ribosomal protein S20 [Fibromonadaceae bacterium]|nr:30S ribosomal protein S20 [Fibromonadaceae bacterium]
MAAKKMVPPNKSCVKRLRQAAKANAANRSTRSAIRTSLGIVRKAAGKVEKDEALKEALKEVPRLFSMLDKAAAKGRAGFNKNRASNYKSKVGLLLNKLSVQSQA